MSLVMERRMTGSRSGIDWRLLAAAASLERGGALVCAYVAESMRCFGFRRAEDTERFYRAVATFLEDGWRSQQEYRKLSPEVAVLIDPNDFGRIVASVVRGYRYEQHVAQKAGAAWIGEGEGLIRLDVAAFLFFKATVPR